MSTKSEYTLIILGTPQAVKRKLPPKIKNSHKRLHNITEDPLIFLYGLGDKKHFDKAKLLFDNPEIQLNNGIRIKELHKRALEENPDLKKQDAYNKYAQKHFSNSYSKLVERIKGEIVSCFEDAFSQLNNEAIEISDPAPFLKRHLTCNASTLGKFKNLADQGHIFSQHLTGLLLTTMAGDFSKTGIKYLLKAYENRFPRSMDALAEYLLYRKDYLGAVQCSLLSIDSLDDSKHTMQTIMSCTSGLLHSESMIPLLFFIFKHVLDDKFTALGKKHFPEFYPSDEEIAQQEMQFFFGRRG